MRDPRNVDMDANEELPTCEKRDANEELPSCEKEDHSKTTEKKSHKQFMREITESYHKKSLECPPKTTRSAYKNMSTHHEITINICVRTNPAKSTIKEDIIQPIQLCMSTDAEMLLA